jgi:hypothetical protein
MVGETLKPAETTNWQGNCDKILLMVWMYSMYVKLILFLVFRIEAALLGTLIG